MTLVRSDRRPAPGALPPRPCPGSRLSRAGLLVVLAGGLATSCAANRIPPSRDSLKLDDNRSTDDGLVFGIRHGPDAGLRVKIAAGPLEHQTFQGFLHAELTLTLTVDNGSPRPVEFDFTRFALETPGGRLQTTRLLENGSPIPWLHVIPGESRQAQLIFKFGGEEKLGDQPVVTLLWCYEIDQNLFCRRNTLKLRLAH